ncbi:FadR family transcriptional regulator [Desulfofundulus sp. TPOSR]|uniref:FadR/GntR family transcriptional regulator n=1 Tax=Desulfofundulus sp. TPOSR TaxID=2714340 RepID=UPI00140D9DB4|nr:FadR/GntR family transcriptional regulator [Desulfofundulus sp. TPOSR]NHM28790.1 FadR family transcriptional regulator [Desulfofundulus sp. TPOSR]
MFVPVVSENTNRSQRIVAQIRSLVAEGKLKPGDRLPPERELAQLMNVSRTSVREAIQILATMGMVTIKKGQGIFIAQNDATSLMNTLGELLVVKKDEIKDLLEVRKVLETQAVSLAVERASDEELLTLREIVEDALARITTNEVDPAYAREHDARFHGAIFSFTRNHVLIAIVSSLYHVYDRMRSRTTTIPGRAIQSIKDHQRIMEAISRRDKDAAVQAMLEHIQSVERAL